MTRRRRGWGRERSPQIATRQDAGTENEKARGWYSQEGQDGRDDDDERAEVDYASPGDVAPCCWLRVGVDELAVDERLWMVEVIVVLLVSG